MKIVIVSNFDRSGGGAHIAAARLAQALIASNHQVSMLVKVKSTEDDYVVSICEDWICKTKAQWKEIIERVLLIPRIGQREEWFNFSTGRWGMGLDRHPLVKQADVVHLHWINKSFVSLTELLNISNMGIRLVWTMHDMWPFTGGCHYAKDCIKFENQCGECPILKGSNVNDLSRQIWLYKKDIFDQINIIGVTCSSWLMKSARKSSLWKNQEVHTINNPIDTSFFVPPENKQLNYRLLFIARDIRDKRKGLDLLLKAINTLHDIQPKLASRLTLVLGGAGTVDINDAKCKIEHKGYIKSANDIRELYQSSDLFVLPSREDNLPNTLVEASSCGVPSIAFGVGGIPEMIEEAQTGFLVEPENDQQLAEKLNAFFSMPKEKQLLFGQNARELALRKYSPSSVASAYLEVYQNRDIKR